MIGRNVLGRLDRHDIAQQAVRLRLPQILVEWRVSQNETNQQAVVARDGAIRKASADAAGATSWTTGRLVFRDTPLAAAIAEVNRYSDRKVELAGAGLAARPVSGFFDVGDSESFARAAADLFDLSLSRGADGAWRLAPAPAPAPGRGA